MLKNISYDTLIRLVIVGVPLSLLWLVPSANNPYMNDVTIWIVMLISAFTIAGISLNQKLKMPLLDVLILVYVLYWHLRFLTLAVFPEYDLVLTRTVSINPDTFNSYSLIVMGAFVSAIVGFYLAYKYISFQMTKNEGKGLLRLSRQSINIDVSDKFIAVVVYFYLVLLFHSSVISFFGVGDKPLWVGYLSLFFNPIISTFIMFLLLFSPRLMNKKKLFVCVSFVMLVLLMMVSGSRSTLIDLILSAFIMLFILGRKPSFNYKNIITLVILCMVVFLSFAYATFQRDLKATEGLYSLTSMKYTGCKMANILLRSEIGACQELYASISPPKEGDADPDPDPDHMASLKSSVGGLFGYAFARAGYLDYSAEFYANGNYDSILNFNNISKSLLDNSVPGGFFEDSRRIQHRIRDVYNPTAVGYQSDAIGVVGENYRLFSSFYPVAIIVVSFLFVSLFCMCRQTVLGLYCQYIIAMAVVSWWNTHGYDTLIIDKSRELIIGVIVINIIMFDWNKKKKNVF
ncbi:MAG: hypothetical protein ACJAS1_002294 [Oleiphilaceae bacterium]|jgi:hypothetical protein